jgi:hypothetical protein
MLLGVRPDSTSDMDCNRGCFRLVEAGQICKGWFKALLRVVKVGAWILAGGVSKECKQTVEVLGIKLRLLNRLHKFHLL